MRTGMLRIALSVLATMSVPVASHAQSDRAVTRMTRADVLALLQANGIEAHLPDQPTRQPTVRAVLGGMRGAVMLFDCEEERCGSLKFVASGNADARHDLAYLNAWNAWRRYAAAYLHEGKVYLYRDYDLRAGVTTAALAQELKTFELLVRNFGSFKP